MVEYIPFPDPRTLLPPLLACLATAFSSTRPPPALLPLLSPILRQRTQFLTSSSSSTSDSWLRLLSWDAAQAERVQNIVENATFEPHPSSGEIELSDDVPVSYKRIDQETLRSQLPLSDFNLTAVYVWCPTDQEAGGPGWRLAELLPGGSLRDEADTWSSSIGEANESRQQRLVEEALKDAEKHTLPSQGAAPPNIYEQQLDSEDGEDEDDDYWARYDATPGRTPLSKPSPALNQGQQLASEASYFDRYNDIQPALENDDPSVEKNEVGDSSLNGDILVDILRRQSETVNTDGALATPPQEINGHDSEEPVPIEPGVPLSHPRPSSVSSVGSDAVSKLEKTAENQSSSEIAVKQHISSNMKSLFRLARSTGISKGEFDSLVRRELELLSLVDGEEE